jgi:uridine kinase
VEGRPARVVLLCGPSGSGKSRIARASGLPVLRLDDFYRDGDDPAMPRSADLGIVDWDDPRSWKADDAVAALETLCRTGSVEVPAYEIGQDRAVGTYEVSLDGAPAVVAEGVFATEIVDALNARGLLADAVVLHRKPWKNFVRRFARDLAERRKPPLTLWRRGRLLMADEPGIVAAACAKGCRAVGAAELAALLRHLRDGD